MSEQGKELAKLKEEVSSANIKVRWAQNKLKAETDAHKVSCGTGPVSVLLLYVCCRRLSPN